MIRKAKTEEVEAVIDFYDTLIDHMGELEYRPGWQKGIYPAYDYLKESIEKEEVFLMVLEGKIISAMIINNQGNESYKDGKWLTDAGEGEYLVIHALGVMPDRTRRGYAKEMVFKAISYAKEKGYRLVRLDVLEGNESARLLYESTGFGYADTIKMFYEDTGWVNFLLYEYKIDESVVLYHRKDM